MMNKKFSKTEMKGLPGGPNQQFTYVTGVFMQDMYHVPKLQDGNGENALDEIVVTPRPTYNDSMRLYNQALKNIYEGKPYAHLHNKKESKELGKRDFLHYMKGYSKYNYESGDPWSYKDGLHIFEMPFKDAVNTDEFNKQRIKPSGFLFGPESAAIPLYEKPTGTPPADAIEEYQPLGLSDYMRVQGMDSSFDTRSKWAQMFGIKDYKGTAEQNVELLKLLQEYKKNPIRAQNGLDFTPDIAEFPSDNTSVEPIITMSAAERRAMEAKGKSSSIIPRAVQYKIGIADPIESSQGFLTSKDTTIDLTNRPMDFARVNEFGEGRTIIGGDFIESKNDAVRKASDWLNAPEGDTYSDQNLQTKDIESFYGIEDNSFKVGKASEFKPETLIIPRRYGAKNISKAVLNEDGGLRILDDDDNPIYQNVGAQGKFILYSPTSKKSEFNFAETGQSAVDKVNLFRKNNPDAQIIILDNGRYAFYGDNPQGLTDRNFIDYYSQDLDREGNPGYNLIVKQDGGEGYRKGAQGYNDPYKFIPSGNITMTEQDGTPLNKGPLLGIDNLGNQQMMFPGYDYKFPGNTVMEIPMAQKGNGEYNLPEVTVYPNMDAFGRPMPNIKRKKETISEAEPFDYSRYLSHPHEFLPRNLAENPIIDLTNEVFNPFNWISDVDKGANNLVDRNYKQGALQIVDGIPIGNPYKIFKYGMKQAGPKNLLKNILKQLGIEQVENETIEEMEKGQFGKYISGKNAYLDMFGNIVPINEQGLKAFAGEGSLSVGSKRNPMYLKSSVKPFAGYTTDGFDIFDLKGSAGLGVKQGGLNAELGFTKDLIRNEPPGMYTSLGFNNKNFGFNAGLDIPTKKPGVTANVNMRYSPTEKLQMFLEGAYDFSRKSPENIRAGLNYRFKKGGMKKYQEGSEPLVIPDFLADDPFVVQNLDLIQNTKKVYDYECKTKDCRRAQTLRKLNQHKEDLNKYIETRNLYESQKNTVSPESIPPLLEYNLPTVTVTPEYESRPDYRISDYFQEQGLDPSFENRKKYAEAFSGVAPILQNYTGTEEQNLKLLELTKDFMNMPRAQAGMDFKMDRVTKDIIDEKLDNRNMQYVGFTPTATVTPLTEKLADAGAFRNSAAIQLNPYKSYITEDKSNPFTSGFRGMIKKGAYPASALKDDMMGVNSPGVVGFNPFDMALSVFNPLYYTDQMLSAAENTAAGNYGDAALNALELVGRPKLKSMLRGIDDITNAKYVDDVLQRSGFTRGDFPPGTSNQDMLDYIFEAPEVTPRSAVNEAIDEIMQTNPAGITRDYLNQLHNSLVQQGRISSGNRNIGRVSTNRGSGSSGISSSATPDIVAGPSIINPSVLSGVQQYIINSRTPMGQLKNAGSDANRLMSILGSKISSKFPTFSSNTASENLDLLANLDLNLADKAVRAKNVAKERFMDKFVNPQYVNNAKDVDDFTVTTTTVQPALIPRLKAKLLGNDIYASGAYDLPGFPSRISLVDNLGYGTSSFYKKGPKSYDSATYMNAKLKPTGKFNADGTPIMEKVINPRRSFKVFDLVNKEITGENPVFDIGSFSADSWRNAINRNLSPDFDLSFKDYSVLNSSGLTKPKGYENVDWYNIPHQVQVDFFNNQLIKKQLAERARINPYGYVEVPYYRVTRNYEQGGEMKELVKKYTTKGWNSLNDNEKKVYKQYYNKSINR